MRPRHVLWLAVVFSLAVAVTASAGSAKPTVTPSVPTAISTGGSAAGVSKGQSRLGLESLPLAAQSVVSAALGAEKRTFFPSRSPGGYRLDGGGVAAGLNAGGVALRAGGVSVAMTVASIGRGSRSDQPKVLSLRAHANRVSLDRGGLTEWYAAGPLGIEQGFTLSRRPAGTAGVVTLALRLNGEVRARQAVSGTVSLTRPGRAGLTYGALSVIDADGRAVRSALEVRGSALLIRVWDQGASYPLVIDPLIQQGGKLTASGEIGGGGFGYSVALSADGNTALIGGPEDDSQVGAAWVFTRSGGTWTQQGAKLTGSGAIGGGRFGVSVALSSDGNTALIGGNTDNFDIGAAWVFTRSGGTWTQQGAKLSGSGESGDGEFGRAVALSADGNTALIGGDADTSDAGAAWVFTRSGSTWTQQGAKLTASDETGDASFGESVALSADGNTALVGGDGDNTAVGAAWVFTRSGSTWTQQGSKLTGTGESGPGRFGWSAALSSDGNTALIGGYFDALGVGAAWVFTRSGSTWTQQGSKLTGGGEVGDAAFGYSVDLSSDGNIALIGGPDDDGNLGAAWMFIRSGDTWAQEGSKATGAGETGHGKFGLSVALSSEGRTSLIGGPNDTSIMGAAWVFSRVVVPGAPTVVTATPGNGQATVSFTPPAPNGGPAITSYTVTASPGGATATGPASPIVVTGLTNGTAYTFTVTATNADGTGPPSAPSSPVTPATVPGAPTGVLVSVGDGEVTVTFVPPASNGGAVITQYNVTVSPGGQTVSKYASPVFVFGLTNGTSYTFTVTATNAAGTGPPSTVSAAAVPTAVAAGRPAPAPPALAGARPDAPDPPAARPRPLVPAH